jgi:2-alkyl-3-oxoalkanoate reductase
MMRTPCGCGGYPRSYWSAAPRYPSGPVHGVNVRSIRIPSGRPVWSHIHIDDAADATVLAIERGGSGVYNVVDDEPAPVHEWLPYLADVLGAKPPIRVPAWLVRPMLGEHGVSLMTTTRGSSNAKAKRELGWEPTYRSWRQGFRDGLG